MKITLTVFLAGIAFGNLLLSPTAKAVPIIVADTLNLKKKEEGIAFSANHVALTEDELNEFQSLLSTFEQENRQRLEAGFFGAIAKIGLKFGAKCLINKFVRKRGCLGEADGMLTGKEKKVELTKDQALRVELFLDAAAQATISEDRDDPVEDRGFLSGDERMVAVLDTTMSPISEDSSSALSTDPEISEYLTEMSEFLDGGFGSEARKSKPISRFTRIPMTQSEIDGAIALLDAFEKENSVLKENEKFLPGLIRFGASLAVSFFNRDMEGGLGMTKTATKKKSLELTADQAEALEAYMDEIADKYIEEDRANFVPSKQTLRGGAENGEEGLFSFVAFAASVVIPLLKE